MREGEGGGGGGGGDAIYALPGMPQSLLPVRVGEAHGPSPTPPSVLLPVQLHTSHLSPVTHTTSRVQRPSHQKAVVHASFTKSSIQLTSAHIAWHPRGFLNAIEGGCMEGNFEV